VRRRIITGHRRGKLADFCLNCTVVSLAMAVYEEKYVGILVGALFLRIFFLLTEED